VPSARVGRGRWRATVAVATVVAAATAFAPARADSFVQGSGSGIATGVKVGPQTGGLTIAVTFGQALADFQGNVGRASARSIDFGILETALTAPGCNGLASSVKQSDFPQPLDADSRDPESNKGKWAQQGGNDPAGPLFVAAGHEEVQADPTPVGRASSTVAAFAIPGLISVGAGKATVVSHIVDGVTREVVATVDVSGLDLGGGAVKLSGLHWEAIHRTGKDEAATGEFSIGSLVVGGAKVPIPGGGTELATVLAPVNAVLLGFGLSLDPPVLDVRGGAAALTPLRVRLDHSPFGQAVIAPLVTAAQPVREPLIDLYSEQVSCESPVGSQEIPGKVGRAVVLPSDIAISAFTGTGGFIVELGGARATTEGQVYANPFEGGVPPSSVEGLSIGAPDSSDFAATGFTDQSIGAVSPPGVTAAGPGEAVLASPSLADSIPGNKGGTAAAVGLLGILAVIGVAVADYLRMQRGRRIIPEVG
jgi:hypothetical protein